MRLDLLAAFLETNHLGTRGVDIFVHRMPADVTTGILLRGPLHGMPIDWNLPGYHKHPMQVIVRATNQAAGDTLAAQVSSQLTLYRTEFRDGGVLKMIVQQLVPVMLPIVFPRSEKGDELEWSINFDAVYTLH